MLLFIGLIAGTVGSLVGLGGGIIIVPLLIGLHSLSPQLAVQVTHEEVINAANVAEPKMTAILKELLKRMDEIEF